MSRRLPWWALVGVAVIHVRCSLESRTYCFTGNTWIAFTTRRTSSPGFRSSSSRDSVVSTEAIVAGAVMSNFTSDRTEDL